MDKETVPDHVSSESIEAVGQTGAVSWTNLDSAIVGHARIWREGAWRDVLVYSRNLLVDAVYDSSDGECGFCEADEYVDYNIIGQYAGPTTPICVNEWV